MRTWSRLQNWASRNKTKQSWLDDFNGLNEFKETEGRDAGLHNSCNNSWAVITRLGYKFSSYFSYLKQKEAKLG